MQKKICDTILYADHILTQNEKREHIENGAMAIHEGRIVALGTAQTVDTAWQSTTQKRFANTLLMPGLINVHTHASMTYLRGLADDLPLMQWLTEYIFPTEQKISREIVEIGAQLGFFEMLRTGTTACIDMYLAEDSVFAAAHKMGIRCQGGEGIFLFPSLGSSGGEATFDVVRAHAEKCASHPRLSTAVMAHAVYTTSPDLLQKCADLATELSLPIHMHVAETTTETAESLKQWGKRPVAVCEEAGLLRPGTSFAHVVDVNPNEIALLAKHGVSVAHCPSSNMKLASGVAPVAAMRQAGIQVGLGTDGAASNNRLNMFTEMREAALLHKVMPKNPTVLRAQEVLDMATRVGGRIFAGLHAHDSAQCLGVLEVGRQADVIGLSLHEPHMQPMYVPSSHLIYAATGHEVIFTMVQGNTVYTEESLHSSMYRELLEEMQKIRTWVWKNRK